MSDDWKARWKRRLPLVALGLLGLGALWAFPGLLTPERLAAEHRALLDLRLTYPLAMALGFVATYVAVVALSIPGATVLSLAGGYLFGLFPGLLLNLAGATLGALALFGAVRLGLAEDIARQIRARGGAPERLYHRLRAQEIPALLAMRFLPAVPFFLANLIAALAGLVRAFALTTVIGILPGSVIITQIGAGLETVFASGATPDLSLFLSPAIWVPLLGLAVLSALPVVFGRKP